MLYKGKELQEFEGICSPKFKNLSGQNFGDYYVICRGPNGDKSGTRFWTECKCGKIELKFSSHLLNSKVKSCVQCAVDKYSEESFEGVGDISYAYWNCLKRGAAGDKSKRKSRLHKEFDITIEFAWGLFLKQDRKCALSGVPIKFITIGRNNKQKLKEQTASLDRIDSSKGYTEDNVQWVHKDVNRMKNVFNQNYFISVCKAIANNNL